MTTEPNVLHSTIIVERSYDAPPARVFSAWSNADERLKSDVPGEGCETTDHVQEFRSRRTRGQPLRPRRRSALFERRTLSGYRSERAIACTAGTIHDGDLRMSATMSTIELTAADGGTRVRVTDQSAYFNGLDNPADREMGWNAIIENLQTYLDKAKLTA